MGCIFIHLHGISYLIDGFVCHVHCSRLIKIAIDAFDYGRELIIISHAGLFLICQVSRFCLYGCCCLSENVLFMGSVAGMVDCYKLLEVSIIHNQVDFLEADYL